MTELFHHLGRSATVPDQKARRMVWDHYVTTGERVLEGPDVWGHVISDPWDEDDSPVIHICDSCSRKHMDERDVTVPRFPIVYVIHAVGTPLVKIGYTAGSPMVRMANLQTGAPVELALLWFCQGSEALEEALHQHFDAYRVRGEWFDLTPLGDDPVAAVQSAILTNRENSK